MQRSWAWGLCAVALAGLMSASQGFAATGASATLSSQQVSANSWQYSLDLTNTGDTQINTFWTGWIVYAGFYVYDLLPTAPSSVSSPSGWNGLAVNDSPYSPGKYGVEWVSPTGLAPGDTLTGFTFTSSDDPATVGGESFFGGYPVRESWVYHGASQSEPGFELTPSVLTPEPATALLLPAALLLAMRRTRRTIPAEQS